MFILIKIKLITIKLITSLSRMYLKSLWARTSFACVFVRLCVCFGTKNSREFHLSPATPSPREATLVVVAMLVDPRCVRENYVKLSMEEKKRRKNLELVPLKYAGNFYSRLDHKILHIVCVCQT
jgi:hypothetical protein